ncbi:putative haloacid dehalogenase-like hydrolase [Leishmania major strain Friedlin]|uniref:Putative haloacid dehalogenase-like hydrolase n=1 Tax=Leishmania major TaxID=5664 RepID=Q4Q8C9_LEIMA|nr:putative haloacid dehalogenase-like hydrolase [Leishmania major strain Friedlin]CAG9577245.1 haloacid_dehalogenase-like_hydrolase_-_putative [Leishmania major strain Friedlin]CAJ05411.1 putative haloacid dehalogenase-like hydrolase [Leishmania major strain Friedlin]|eukprot:XP_001684419.1 putative haloacid dehalogenase-like hydrolase [Leishmania major strain Friedlin]
MARMPIKAVVTDLDGTLLDPQHCISNYAAEVLKKIKEKGICFIVATGRPYAEVFNRIRHCHLAPDYIITSNGARIHDGAFNVVREHNLRPELVESLARVRTVKDPATGAELPKKFTTNIYRGAEWLTDKSIPEVSKAFHTDFQCTDLRERFYELQASELGDVHEIWFAGDHDELVLLDNALREKYPGDLCCTFSLPHLLDCVPAGVNKGNGVREAAEMLGLALDEVACFGDGMNDESMLQVTSTSFIMANAQQRLKDAVPHAQIIGSNADDGVAKKLEEMFFSA